MKAVAVISHLLLQKPHRRSSEAENRKHLVRRLDLWRHGELDALYDDVSTLQASLKHNPAGAGKDNLIRSFTNLELTGKVNAALRLITEKSAH